MLDYAAVLESYVIDDDAMEGFSISGIITAIKAFFKKLIDKVLNWFRSLKEASIPVHTAASVIWKQCIGGVIGDADKLCKTSSNLTKEGIEKAQWSISDQFDRTDKEIKRAVTSKSDKSEYKRGEYSVLNACVSQLEKCLRTLETWCLARAKSEQAGGGSGSPAHVSTVQALATQIISKATRTLHLCTWSANKEMTTVALEKPVAKKL